MKPNLATEKHGKTWNPENAASTFLLKINKLYPDKQDSENVNAPIRAPDECLFKEAEELRGFSTKNLRRLCSVSPGLANAARREGAYPGPCLASRKKRQTCGKLNIYELPPSGLLQTC